MKNTVTIKQIEEDIERALSQKLSPVEKGRIYTKALITYAQLKKELDMAYLETLNKSIQLLGDLMQEEKTQNDEIKKESIRRKLQEIDDMD